MLNATSRAVTLLVIPTTALAGARANSDAGPKGGRQDGASEAGIQRLALSLLFVSAELSLALRASELLFGLAQKVTKKASAHRGVLPRIVRGKIPCASRRRRGRLTVHPCTAADARASCARPFGPSSPPPAMLGTANGALLHESVHPCTASRNYIA